MWPNLYILTLPSPWIHAALEKGTHRASQLPVAKQMLKKLTARSSLLTAVCAAGQQVFPGRGIPMEHLHVCSKHQTSR